MANTGLIRGETEDATLQVTVANEKDLRLALALHDGINAKQQLQTLAKQRYGTTIQKVEDQVSGNVTYKIVSDGTDDAIDAQRYEAFPTNFCRRMVKTKGSLFTSDSQVWSVTIPGEEDEQVTEEDAEEEIDTEERPSASDTAQTLWMEYREKGQANLKLIRADRLSVLMRVSAIYMTWRSRRIAYDVLSAFNMFFLFNETLEDDGEVRPVVTTELEDATAFIVESIRVAPKGEDSSNNSSTQKRRFTAWVGRTEKFPVGRLLSYEETDWADIPEPGAANILFEDERGNPFTEWMNDHQDEDSIEYPVALFFGTDAGEAEDLLPTEGIGLAETCVEIDLFTSRAMTASLDAAVGLQVNTTEKEITHQNPYPNIKVGQWMGAPGQKTEFKTNGAEHSLKAMENLFNVAQFLAENHDVPGYMVTPDSVSAPESGIALAIRTMPMQDDRQERATQAKSSVQRMFEIEKRLTDIYADPGMKIPLAAELSWNPGQLELPESETERIANIKAKEDAKYIDHVEGVRQANQLETREEAEAIIEAQGLEAAKQESALDRIGGGLQGETLGEIEEDVEAV
jgi:hypothetical protein